MMNNKKLMIGVLIAIGANGMHNAWAMEGLQGSLQGIGLGDAYKAMADKREGVKGAFKNAITAFRTQIVDLQKQIDAAGEKDKSREAGLASMRLEIDEISKEVKRGSERLVECNVKFEEKKREADALDAKKAEQIASLTQQIETTNTMFEALERTNKESAALIGKTQQENERLAGFEEQVKTLKTELDNEKTLAVECSAAFENMKKDVNAAAAEKDERIALLTQQNEQVNTTLSEKNKEFEENLKSINEKSTAEIEKVKSENANLAALNKVSTEGESKLRLDVEDLKKLLGGLIATQEQDYDKMTKEISEMAEGAEGTGAAK